MRVTVIYFAALRERAGRRESVEEIGPGTTAGSLWDVLASREEFRGLATRPGLSVNGGWCGAGRVLVDGDEVGLLPPVSGG